MALNFYSYKTFVIFLKIMESVGDDDANSVFHEFKSDTFESDTIFVTFKSVTFEIFGKCSESVNFDANNDLQEDLKIFKSDTFENYKHFVHVEVQSHYCITYAYSNLFVPCSEPITINHNEWLTQYTYFPFFLGLLQ